MKLFRKMVWSLPLNDNDFAQKVGRDILVPELSVLKISTVDSRYLGFGYLE